jgi:hypothetical protein
VDYFRVARLDILYIDELGDLNLKPEQTNIFFKLMEERYRRHSTFSNFGCVNCPNEAERDAAPFRVRCFRTVGSILCELRSQRPENQCE